LLRQLEHVSTGRTARCDRRHIACRRVLVSEGRMAMKAVWKFMFRKHSLRIAALMCCAVGTTAAAMDRGQFNNVPPAIREWFENMRSPKGTLCCSYADGHRTGYDIRQGQYWVPIDGQWFPVPPEAVIKTENPVGEAIVWYSQNGAEAGDLPRNEWYRIICFVPSGDV
jgi:hypothetical protein